MTDKLAGDNPKKVDASRRPEYAAIPDLQPRLDEKNAALAARIETLEKQQAKALDAFPPAPGTKIVDSGKVASTPK